MKAIFLRSSFVLAILAGGLTLERLYYSHKTASSDVAPLKVAAGAIKVLVAGGSMADGLAASLSSHLEMAAPTQKYSVYQYIFAGLSTNDALSLQEVFKEQFHPDVVLLMLGCMFNESKDESTFRGATSALALDQIYQDILSLKKLSDGAGERMSPELDTAAEDLYEKIINQMIKLKTNGMIGLRHDGWQP